MRDTTHPSPEQYMRKPYFLIPIFCCSVIFLLAISLMGCVKTSPSDFYDALTAVAATVEYRSTLNPVPATETTTLTPGPLATTRPEKCLAESSIDSVNIRSGPSGGIIGCCLGKGEKLEIQQIDLSGQWALIVGLDRTSHQGWVKLSLLKIIGECGMIPE